MEEGWGSPELGLGAKETGAILPVALARIYPRYARTWSPCSSALPSHPPHPPPPASVFGGIVLMGESRLLLRLRG